MCYNGFLKISSQLAEGCKASALIDDRMIFVEKINSNAWRISCYIGAFNEELIPSKYLNSMQELKWKESGPYLKLKDDSSCLMLMYDVKNSGKYLSFRNALGNFLPVAKEWDCFFSSRGIV